MYEEDIEMAMEFNFDLVDRLTPDKVIEDKLKEGVIVAKNHIHMTEEDSRRLNLKDKDKVKVKICGSLRPMIFEDVVVRVNNRFSLNMHIDYDEANACFLTKDSYGEIYE